MAKKLRKRLAIANWKMNPLSGEEADRLFRGSLKLIPVLKKTDVVFCLPYLYLASAVKIIRRVSKKISLGAQDSSPELGVGAYTGDISPNMLYACGARYVILGHSERRNSAFGPREGDKLINKKIKSALSAGLSPVLCVGEEHRDASHKYLLMVKEQVLECLSGVSKAEVGGVVIAYEPVWAVGRGARPATPVEFREMSVFLRRILSDKFGSLVSSRVKVLYGGSVDERNVVSFLSEGEAEGFLVGRASLDPRKFSDIVKACEVYGN